MWAHEVPLRFLAGSQRNIENKIATTNAHESAGNNAYKHIGLGRHGLITVIVLGPLRGIPILSSSRFNIENLQLCNPMETLNFPIRGMQQIEYSLD